MVIIFTSLSELRIQADLAAAICIPVPALDAVSLLSADQNNHRRCIICQQSWFPRKFDRNGQVAKYRRDYGIYGPQFLRNFRGKASMCCCKTLRCEKRGYLHEGMIRLSKKPYAAAVALYVLDLPAGAL
jgi:hypothetical protein